MSGRDTATIAAYNDRFRQTLDPLLGYVIPSPAVQVLSPDRFAELLAAIRAFEAFDPDCDPWHERDMGIVDCAGDRYLFKIDCYDRRHQPAPVPATHPADPLLTLRVMTIARWDEMMPPSG